MILFLHLSLYLLIERISEWIFEYCGRTTHERAPRFLSNRIHSHVDLIFKDEVEGMHRTTLFPITEGDITPDNFFLTALLEKWENLEAFESRRRMHVLNLANSFKKMKFKYNPRRGHDIRQNQILISKQMRAYDEACFNCSIILTDVNDGIDPIWVAPSSNKMVSSAIPAVPVKDLKEVSLKTWLLHVSDKETNPYGSFFSEQDSAPAVPGAVNSKRSVGRRRRRHWRRRRQKVKTVISFIVCSYFSLFEAMCASFISEITFELLNLDPQQLNCIKTSVVLPSAAIPLGPSSNGIDSMASSSSYLGSGGGGIGEGQDGADERSPSHSSENGGSGEHGSGVGEVGEGSIEIQQNRRKRTKGATCDCCLKTDETAKGTQWHSVCLGWRVAVALATNQFHRCLDVKDVVICHKCYQLTSGELREACAGVLIAHPEINGLQNFMVVQLPEALKALQVCFNLRGAIACFNAIHISLRPSNGWSVLPASIGSQVYLIPGEGDSSAGVVLLVSIDRGMITVADNLTVGSRSSQIIVNHARIFRPDDILHPSTQTERQHYPISREASRRDSNTLAVAEVKELTANKVHLESEIAAMKLQRESTEQELATLKFDLAEASKSYDEAVTQLSHRENAHKALEKEWKDARLALEMSQASEISATSVSLAQKDELIAAISADARRVNVRTEAELSRLRLEVATLQSSTKAEQVRILKTKLASFTRAEQRSKKESSSDSSSSRRLSYTLRSSPETSRVLNMGDDETKQPFLERLARHVTSDEALGHIDASTDDAISALEALRKTLKDAAASIGAKAVVCIVESLFTSTFFHVCGESMNFQMHQFVRHVMDGSISTTQSWKKLWCEVPGAIIIAITKASASAAELSSDLGPVRQHLLLTQSMQVVSSLCVMINPLCTQISQASVSLIMMTGKGGTQLGREVLYKLGVSTGHSASTSQQLVLQDQGTEIVSKLIRLAVSMGLPLFLIFDNADWSKLADIAIHLVHYILWFGDKTSGEMPVTKSLPDLDVHDFEESAEELQAKIESDDNSNAWAMSIVDDTNAERTVQNLMEDRGMGAREAQDVERVLKHSAALGRKKKPLYQASPDQAEQIPRRQLSTTMLRQMTAVRNEVGGLPCVLESNNKEILIPFTANLLTGPLRSHAEAGPISVVIGDMVSVIQIFDSPDRNIAAVIRQHDKTYGWIPLACITGDVSNFPPTDRMAFLTTPIAKQQGSLFQRMDEVHQVSFLDGYDSSSTSDIEEICSEDDRLGDEDWQPEFSVPELFPLNRVIDDDRKFVKAVAEAIRESGVGAAPKYPASCVPMTTLDGRASSMHDWIKGVRISEKIVRDAVAGLVDINGLSKTVVMVHLTDHQEFKEAHDSKDRRREEIQKRVELLEQVIRLHETTDDERIRAETELKTALIQRNAIDKEVAHLFGYFHGSMGSIRGWCNSHAGLGLQGLLSWAGYGHAFEKISTCSNGYYKLAIDLLICASIAWRCELIVVARKSEMMTDASDMLTVFRELSSKSQTLRVFDVAFRDQLSTILDMQLASRLRGIKSRHLLNSSVKRVIGVFAMGGNVNFVHAVVRDMRQTLTASQEQLEAIVSNPTLTLRERCTSMPGDQNMENYGIASLKEFLSRPHSSNVVEKANLLKSVEGKIKALLESMEGSGEEPIVFGASRQVVDKNSVIARMRAAFRLNIMPNVSEELYSESEPEKISKVPIVVGIGSQPSMSANANMEYLHNFVKIQLERIDEVIKYNIRSQIGGSQKGVHGKKVVYSTISVERKARNAVLRSLQKDRVRLTAALGIVAQKGSAELEKPHCVCEGVGLWKNAKSIARVAIRELIFSPCNSTALSYVESGIRFVGADEFRNTIGLQGGSNVVQIHVLVLDANMFMRRARPYTNTTSNQTGVNEIMSILEQFVAFAFLDGYLEVHFILDAGGCLQKKIEESSRDEKKAKKGPIKIPERRFVFGNLGKRSPSYLQSLFNDRTESGGRHQVQSVFREVINLAISGDDPQLTARFRKLLTIGPNGGGVLCVSGAGSNHESRSELLTLRADPSSNTVLIESSGGTTHREDVMMMLAALKRGIHKGLNAKASAADGDVWKMGLVAIEKANFYHRPVGIFAVVMTEIMLPGGVMESHFNCNEGVCAIVNDSRLSIIPTHLRAINYVAFSEALGGDITHSIRGITQKSGMAIILHHLSYIGTLVRLASPEESHKGLSVAVNADAYIRLNMILYAARDSAVFMDLWPGSSVELRGNALDQIGYENMEKLMAQRKIPDVNQFMLSLPNLPAARGRLEGRINTWYNSDLPINEPFQLTGIEVDIKDENGIVNTIIAPRQIDIDDIKVVAVRPEFTKTKNGQPLNREFSFLFPDGPTAAMLKRSLDEAAKKVSRKAMRCGRCQHGSHKGGICTVCGISPCIDRCDRCLCARHTGKVCQSCIGVLLNKRCKCLSKCLVCEHPGNSELHSKNGCTDCCVGEGCNLIAALSNTAGQFEPSAETEEECAIADECDLKDDENLTEEMGVEWTGNICEGETNKVFNEAMELDSVPEEYENDCDDENLDLYQLLLCLGDDANVAINLVTEAADSSDVFELVLEAGNTMP